LIVDGLEREGLVERQAHPTDRRVKIVATTAQGTAVAEAAEEILGRPPTGVATLPSSELEELVRILEAAALGDD
jgi:DNA-binding MarR family transcriptional regulator